MADNEPSRCKICGKPFIYYNNCKERKCLKIKRKLERERMMVANSHRKRWSMIK